MMKDALRPGLERRGLLGGLLIGLLMLSGCLSPLAMHQAVLEYDRTVSRVEAEMLLLNVARTRHFHPTHFTALASVAATFEFSTSVGLTPAQAGLTKTLVSPIFGATAAEKPTMTIIPIQGEEFTSRILMPFDEDKVAFLFQQRLEPALILRLMSRELVLSGYGEAAILQNDPSHTKEYPEFRRRALHLSSLYLSRDLFVGPVVYEETFPFSFTRGLSTEETVENLDKILRALEKGYQWIQGPKGEVTLSRRVIGRIVITNYDPSTLTNQERQQLALEAGKGPRNAILVDIQPGYPGGEYPMRGMFIFRSFHSILQFLANGIAAVPEYHVEKDPRTGEIARNPPWTISIEESDSRPPDAAFAVGYEDRWYSIRKAPRATGTIQPWNQVAFRVLSQLYQMTVTEVSRVPTPSITIAK
ncbi:MAG: hypothetical protein SGJ16_02000 [Nitrospirota bacterium]|nr:hypothetical protein [Nitrospirota bacterium]